MSVFKPQKMAGPTPGAATVPAIAALPTAPGTTPGAYHATPRGSGGSAIVPAAVAPTGTTGADRASVGIHSRAGAAGTARPVGGTVPAAYGAQGSSDA